jgi:hypothetical protein
MGLYEIPPASKIRAFVYVTNVYGVWYAEHNDKGLAYADDYDECLDMCLDTLYEYGIRGHVEFIVQEGRSEDWGYIGGMVTGARD